MQHFKTEQPHIVCDFPECRFTEPWGVNMCNGFKLQLDYLWLSVSAKSKWGEKKTSTPTTTFNTAHTSAQRKKKHQNIKTASNLELCCFVMELFSWVVACPYRSFAHSLVCSFIPCNLAHKVHGFWPLCPSTTISCQVLCAEILDAMRCDISSQSSSLASSSSLLSSSPFDWMLRQLPVLLSFDRRTHNTIVDNTCIEFVSSGNVHYSNAYICFDYPARI